MTHLWLCRAFPMDRALGLAANSGKFGMKVLLNQARVVPPVVAWPLSS